MEAILITDLLYLWFYFIAPGPSKINIQFFGYSIIKAGVKIDNGSIFALLTNAPSYFQYYAP
jgi:hypothetical protein